MVDKRIEAWAEGRERCDAVCARALAALPVLCEYAAPLLRPGGVLVAWKGHVDEAEAADARAAAAHLGLAPERVASGDAVSGVVAAHAAHPAQGRADAGALSAPAGPGDQAAAGGAPFHVKRGYPEARRRRAGRSRRAAHWDTA